MLKIKDLNVGYEKVQVLWDVSFNVKEGEIVTLLGSNGAGKSTTVKAIQGLLKPNSGSIRFTGKSINGLPVYQGIYETIISIGSLSYFRNWMSVKSSLLAL